MLTDLGCANDLAAEHPLVTVHPETGERVLYVSPGFVQEIVDSGFEVVLFDNRDIGLSSMTEWTPPSRLKSILSLIFRRPVKGVDVLAPMYAARTESGARFMELTASEDERHKVRGYQYQADSYMSKPYDLDALTARVRKLLERSAEPQSV